MQLLRSLDRPTLLPASKYNLPMAARFIARTLTGCNASPYNVTFTRRKTTAITEDRMVICSFTVGWSICVVRGPRDGYQFLEQSIGQQVKMGKLISRLCNRRKGSEEDTT